MGNRVIALVEPSWNKGHYETQMYLFLTMLLPKNCRLIVLCAEPEKIQEWAANNQPDLPNKLFTARFSLLDYYGRIMAKTGQAWRYLADSLHKTEVRSGWKIDMVFINSLDIFIYANWSPWLFKRNFDYPWAGLYVAPVFRRINLWKKVKDHTKLYIFKGVKNCAGIAILDEGSYDKSQAFFNDRPIIVFPDVTDERLPSPLSDKLARIKEEAGNRPIFGAVGLLLKRKGWLNFLRCAQAIDPDKCFFLTAGHLDYSDYTRVEQLEIKALMARLAGVNCHFELDYIDDPAEVNAYINMCDVVYMCYENFFYSSGIMTKAAAFGKLMLVSEGYCMGDRVTKYGLGLTVKEKDLDEIIAAFTQLAEGKTRKKLLQQAQFDKYMEFHNAQRLDTILSEIMGVDG